MVILSRRKSKIKQHKAVETIANSITKKRDTSSNYFDFNKL